MHNTNHEDHLQLLYVTARVTVKLALHARVYVIRQRRTVAN